MASILPIPYDRQPPARQGYPDIGVVYLVRSAGRYKIGITTNVERRMRQLNGQQSAYPVELVATAEGFGYREFERSIHVRQDASRVYGEWFAFVPDDVATTIELMEEWQEGQDWWR